MDQPSVAEAIKQICNEKGIPFELVIETIEAALAAAYRKDFGEKNQNIKVEFDLVSGSSKVYDVKTVVEDMPELPEGVEGEEAVVEEAPAPLMNAEGEVVEEKRRFNPKTEIQISEAQKIKPDAQLGEEIRTKLEIPGDFGRMAAQTAKQVITQKLREIERESMFQEFKKQEGGILVGTVQRREGRLVLVDLGRLTALLPPEEQIENENYMPGSHVKVYVVSVNSTTKGPEVVVSRSHPEIVKKLFHLEIPEIANGVVQIKSIAREAGSRTKIAVWTDQENIDPIGSCIGQRGARIQTIISELKGEKVDIIKYSDNPVEFIANALSPAKITEITVNEQERTATAKVPDNQLSLAIGKGGQNVRLAAKLTGWKIDIVTDNGAGEQKAAEAVVAPSDEPPPTETEAIKEAVTEPVAVAETTTEEKPAEESEQPKKKGVKKTKTKKST